MITMKNKLKKLIHYLGDGLIERDEPARLTLLATLAGEHVLLIGSPGTAKSELARRLKYVFSEGHYFERLLTKFSVPEELFGPLSIKALEDDRYERLTDSYMPSASIAFIDEIFNANSAILNTLLTILNEREFDNGNQRIKTPLIAVIAASNNLPENHELEALYDRFLVRYNVEPVSDNGFENLLKLPEENTRKLSVKYQLNTKDIQIIQSQAKKLLLSDDVLFLLSSLRKYLQEHSIYVSDRRWRKLVKLLQVAAYTNDKGEVGVWDCWLIQHCLWQTPEQSELIFTWYQNQLGTGSILSPQRLDRLTETWQQTLDKESQKTVPLTDENNTPLYLDNKGMKTTLKGRSYQAVKNGNLLYLAPPDQADRSNDNKGYTRSELQKHFFDDHYQQCHINGKWLGIDKYITLKENQLMRFDAFRPLTEPVRYGKKHITDRVSELQFVLTNIEQYIVDLEARIESIGTDVENHLWISKNFAQPALEVLHQSLLQVKKLSQRVITIRDGFAELPQSL